MAVNTFWRCGAVWALIVCAACATSEAEAAATLGASGSGACGSAVPTVAFRSPNGNAMLATSDSAYLWNAGGSTVGDVVTSQTASGVTYIVARGVYGIWLNAFQPATHSWVGWVPLGGTSVGNPAVSAAPDGSVYVAVRDAIGAYWIGKYVPGIGWGGWTSLGGWLMTDPVIGTSSTVRYTSLAFQWTAGSMRARSSQISASRGGVLAPGLAIRHSGSYGVLPDRAFYVAVKINSSGSIYTARFQGKTWGPWYAGGGSFTSDPALAASGGMVYAVVTKSNAV